MTAGLRIAPGLDLPVDVAGEAIGLLATRGAGKSFTSAVLTEELFRHGIQVVVVDPAGVYWGLQSSYDGKRKGLAIYVLGGLHGDLPLEPTAGNLVADLIVDSDHSFVLDLSGFDTKGEQTKFVTAFAERLYARKGTQRSTLHLILDEADEFAPQKSLGTQEATMLNRVARIVRRGRSRGLGVTLITQRSATLNKDVLDLVETLIVMRMPGPRDREQVKGWISVKDLRDELGVDEALPGLPTGTAFVWSPVRGLLKKAQIRRIDTFDSYRTPKPGETQAEPVTKAELDLAALGEQIAATVEKQKASDPKELRRMNRDLQVRLDEAERSIKHLEVAKNDAEQHVEQVVERIKVPVFGNGEIDRLGEIVDTLSGVARDLSVAAGSIADAARKGAEDIVDRVSVPAPLARPAPRAASAPKPKRAFTAIVSPAAAGERPLSDPEQRVLDSIAWWNEIGFAQPSKLQVGFIAGYRVGKKVGGTFGNLLGALRSDGLIDYPAPGLVELSDVGTALAGTPDIDRTVSGLQGAVYARLDGPERRVLEVLINVYPHALPKQEAGERAGYNVGEKVGGTFGNILGRLRTLGLIDYPRPGEAAAEPVLFLEQP